MDPLFEVEDLVSEIGASKVTIAFGADGSILIPAEYLKEASDNEYSLLLSSDNRTVTLDKDVVQNMSSVDLDGLLSIRVAEPRDLTDDQKEIIGDNYAITLTINLGSHTLSELGGKATVQITDDMPYDHVYYIMNDGTIEEIPCSYDAETKTLTFELTHFSIYTMTVGELDPGHGGDEPEKEDKDNLTLVLAVALIALIAFAAVLFIIIRRGH
jgi:hypothetical protein